MLNYGSNFLGYGAITYGHGPFNNWAHPPTQQTPPTLQFSQPNTMITNAPSTSGSTGWFPDSGASF
jgi:hypothetical protein